MSDDITWFDMQIAEHNIRSELLNMFGEVEIPFRHYFITVSTSDYIVIKDAASTLSLYSEEYNAVIRYMTDKLLDFRRENLLLLSNLNEEPDLGDEEYEEE